MKLRGKTLLIVSVTLICLIGLLYIVSRQVLMLGFAKVEQENTERNVERTLDAFAENYNNLGIKVADWAKWDDTYEFISDKNKGYIESNLNDASIGDLKLNYMFFINTAGAIVFCRGYDPQKEEGYEPSETLKSFILKDSLLTRHKREDAVVTGIDLSPKGPLLIASRPITTSEGKGPIRGAVLFARYLDKAEIGRMAQLTHLSTNVVPCASEEIPIDMAHIAPLLNEKHPIATQPLTPDTVAGYALMPDIHGAPALIVRVSIGRAIYKQGQATMLYLIVAILLAGAIFGAMIMILLEKLVISRVATLSGEVMRIGASSDHSKRVGVSGEDELTHLATSLNDMLGALQKSERAVIERNDQMRLIMNTVPSGLLSLDENFIINPEYSQSVETILGKPNLAGINFFDCLGLCGERESERQKLFEFLDLMRQEVISEKEMAGLNPFEEFPIRWKRDAAIRWLRLRYFLIRRGADSPKHFLVVVEDISEEKALAEKVKQSERENLQLKAIVEDPDLFRDFLSETRGILRNAEEHIGILESNRNRTAVINSLFRDVHTIKGTASSFRLNAISEIAGEMEEVLSPLRESGEITLETMGAMRQSLALLTKAVMDAVENAKKIMGDDFDDDNEMHLKIALSKLRNESAAIEELVRRELVDPVLSERLRRKINAELRSLRMIPARRGLGKALKVIPGLIERLGKKIDFTVDGGDTLIDCEIARELNTPLVHLIRNAFDHGIEATPDERISAGKREEGLVSLRITDTGASLMIELKDDGRGIDPQKLKETAIRKKMLTAAEAAHLNRRELLELIYRPGFTTASSVTEVSGRGVGMDAVMTSIRDALDGSIAIHSEVGKGTSFSIQVPNQNGV